MSLTRARELFKDRFDFLILLLLLGVFLAVAAQRLGDAPLPDTDEAMTLQVPYEMLNRGKLAFPMYRHLGGNIENSWHSYTPVFFLMLGGFQKLFGWGLAQARAFNLLTAAAVLVLTHLIGRRLFGWRAGLLAVGLLISDPTFIDRSRVIRNDFAGAMFALLAFYLYERAAQRGSGKLYMAAGLAAGAGVMCHTNVLYVLAAIGALMWLRHGWRVICARSLYQLAAGALAVMAYEIVYDLIDYKNFLLQNRQDDLHFSVLSGWGWWRNLLDEPTRYALWYDGFLKISTEVTLLRAFLWLSAAGVIYLLIRLAVGLRRGNLPDQPRMRLLVMTVVIAMFFAVVTQRKVVLYVIHLAPWLALCAAVMLSDGLERLQRLRTSTWPPARPLRIAAIAALVGAAGFYGFHFARQSRDYWRAARDPYRATFDQLAGVLRTVVPEAVCPVAIKQGVLWLAFPEKDDCFAALEKRMRNALDLAGNDYALIVSGRRKKKDGKWIGELTAGAKLIAELRRTAYGPLSIYYTGRDPALLALAPARYTFFGRERGYASEAEINAAREVWTADAEALRAAANLPPPPTSSAGFTIQPGGDAAPQKLGSVDLKPATIYQLKLETTGQRGRWEVIVTDDATGGVLYRERLGGDGEGAPFSDVIKTKATGRITVSLREVGKKADDAITVLRVALREVAPVWRAADQ